MAVPDFQTLMLPLLTLIDDGREYALRDAINQLADEFDLTDEERRELLPSGRQARFDNRVGWSKTHLTKAGLIESTKRGWFRITERGRQALQQKPNRIDLKFLDQYPEHVSFRTKTHQPERKAVSNSVPESEQSPTELIELAHQQIRGALAEELLEMIMGMSPSFFETLVVDLLIRMGYGGTHAEVKNSVVGRSGDEGIDGIINEDRLGLDVVYVQAKKWTDSISRPEIQKFAGALQGKRAKKGIFITTSQFSKGAREYTSIIDSRIVLIDGDRLTELMIDYNVGINTTQSYEIKRIDTDYFEE